MKKRKVEIILRGSNYRTHGLSANEFQEALIEAIQEEEKDAIENENYETAKYSKEYLEILKKIKLKLTSDGNYSAKVSEDELQIINNIHRKNPKMKTESPDLTDVSESKKEEKIDEVEVFLKLMKKFKIDLYKNKIKLFNKYKLEQNDTNFSIIYENMELLQPYMKYLFSEYVNLLEENHELKNKIK